MTKVSILLLLCCAIAYADACPSGTAGCVQIKKNVSGSTRNTASVSLTSLPSATNSVLIGITFSQSAAVTFSGCTDNATTPNTFTQDKSQISAGTTVGAALYRVPEVGATSGTYTITCTVAGGSSYLDLFAEEITGLPAVSTIDVSSSKTDVGTGVLCDPLITTNATDVLIALGNNGYGGSLALSPGAGFTMEIYEDSGSAFTGGGLADRAVTSTGTYDPSFTSAVGSTSTCVAVAYKQTAAASTPRKRVSIIQ